MKNVGRLCAHRRLEKLTSAHQLLKGFVVVSSALRTGTYSDSFLCVGFWYQMNTMLPVFWTPKLRVGERDAFQLSLAATTNIDLSAVSEGSVTITLSDNHHPEYFGPSWHLVKIGTVVHPVFFLDMHDGCSE